MPQRFGFALAALLFSANAFATQTSPPKDSTLACASPTQKVDEKGFVKIGGIEQWVTVTGESCANPIILFISGGPGNPLSVYSDAVYGAWAHDFTLVQWDQRGAGMTYGRSPPAEDSEYSTPKALADYEAGGDYSFINFVGLHGDGMASKVDLPALGTDFAIPVFFVEGAQDLLAPPELAQRYYESLKAPQKKLILLPHAGHDPNQDVIDAEFKLLKEEILPLAR